MLDTMAAMAKASLIFLVLQVQRTSDNVAAAGRHAWRATQRTTKRALKSPGTIAKMFRGHEGSKLSHDPGEYSEEETDFNTALLEVR